MCVISAYANNKDIIYGPELNFKTMYSVIYYYKKEIFRVYSFLEQVAAKGEFLSRMYRLVETIPYCFWLRREDPPMPPEVFY